MKLKKTKSKFDREAFLKLCEKTYHNKDVLAVELGVRLKDGTVIGYARDEEEDDHEIIRIKFIEKHVKKRQ